MPGPPPDPSELGLSIFGVWNEAIDAELDELRKGNARLRAQLAPAPPILLTPKECAACVQYRQEAQTAQHEIGELRGSLQTATRLRQDAVKLSMRQAKSLTARFAKIARLKTKLAATEKLLREAEVTIVRLQRRVAKPATTLRVVPKRRSS